MIILYFRQEGHANYDRSSKTNLTITIAGSVIGLVWLLKQVRQSGPFISLPVTSSTFSRRWFSCSPDSSRENFQFTFNCQLDRAGRCAITPPKLVSRNKEEHAFESGHVCESTGESASQQDCTHFGTIGSQQWIARGEVNEITRSYKVCAFIRHGGNAIRLSLRSYPQGQQDNWR